MVMNGSGLPSPTDSYRVFNGERNAWSIQIKAVGQPGHGSKLYDNSAMENLTKSIESIMRFRASEFDQLKTGLEADGDVVSINMVYLKAGTPTPDNVFFSLSFFLFSHLVTKHWSLWLNLTIFGPLLIYKGLCNESATI